MTTLECAALLLQEIAEPRPVCDSVKAAITRAARAVKGRERLPRRPGDTQLWAC